MKNKKYKNTPDQPANLEELLQQYQNSRIHFSTIEEQDEILLRDSMNKTPEERLKTLRLLNEYAYKHFKRDFTFENARITWGRYEYLPG